MANKETLVKKEEKLFKKISGVVLRVTVLALAVLSIYTFSTRNYGTFRPATAEEYAKTSVSILHKEGRGGGSGVILTSNPTESIILTNQHVCEVIVDGGFVKREDTAYAIKEYKMSKIHDLCLIKVQRDLGVSTKVAKNAPRRYSDAHISGHPALLPHVVTHGNFSGRMYINVMTSTKTCERDHWKRKRTREWCLRYGYVPVVKQYDSQLVTGTILPGSSGSAVFNEDGEIAGLVFASRSRELSYAFIVPQEYVSAFVNSESKELKWQKPGDQDPDESEFSKKRNDRLYENPLGQ